MKIIIWGYPLHSHTHSYIHASFYKTFKFLGYDTYWFDDNNYPEDFDWNDCVFWTEGYAEKNIPLNKTSTYFVHLGVNPKKYLGKVKKFIDVRPLQNSMDNDHYDFILDFNSCEKLDDGVLYDKNFTEYDILYLAWATDLLPHEIDFEWVNVERDNKYYFIGSISNGSPNKYGNDFSNYKLIEEFIKCCINDGIPYEIYNPWSNPVSFDQNRLLTQRSIVSPDFRNPTQKKWGYIACRLFKSISYGHIGATNSLKNASFVDDSILYDDSITDLYHKVMSRRNDKETILHQMNIVKNNHTYVNRINGVMKLL